jgi:PAS domain-containing protein
MPAQPAAPETLSAILECFPYPALIVDVRRCIRAVNRLFRESLPDSALGPVGRRCYDVLHGRQRRCDARNAPCPIDACQREAPLTPPVHMHASRDGWRRDRVVVQPIRDAAGAVVACLTTLRRADGGPGRLQPPGNVRVWLVGERLRAEKDEVGRRERERARRER